MMVFASRYQLQDPLLKTTVETFVGSDRETQETVMVHVFAAAEHDLKPSSLPEEVLQRFHQLTQAQVRIRAVGVDAATGFAYVVTPEIDPEYISVWGTAPPADLAPFSTAVLGNQFSGISSSALAEEPALPPRAVVKSPAALGPDAASLQPAAPPEPGSFTKEFMSLQSRNGESAPAAKPASIAPPKPAGEPSLTDILRAVDAASGHPELSSPIAPDSKRKAVPEAAPLPAAPVAPPKPAANNGPSFTALFAGAPAASPSTPPATPAAPINAPPKPQAGAFTAMFGAAEAKAHLEPAAPPRPAPIPAAPVSAPPKAGAFTAMFGAEEAKAHLERPPMPAATPMAPIPPPARAGAFTAMFGADEAKAHLDAKPAAGAFTRMFESQDAPAKPPSTPGIVGAPASTPSIPPTPTAPPSFPAMSAPAANASASPATRFFKGADAVSAPKAPAIPAGPSEYTRVVKFSEAMKQAPLPTSGVPPAPGVPPAGMGIPPINVSGPSFQPPAMPGYPVMPGVPGYQPPQVQMPQYTPPQMPMPGQPYGVPGVVPPPMPQYQPPQFQAPQFQAPPVAAPQVPPAPQSKSWMPLVILFLGLMVVALLIVLLFALKGH